MSNNRRNFKSNNESKQATAEVIGISLADAYEIVGGYQDADEKTLAVAIQMLENDNSDSEFAMQLIKMYKSGTAFKYAKLEDLSDENLEKGLEKATEFSRTAKDTVRETLSDATVNKFIINTPMNDIYGNPVSNTARDEGINLLSRAAEEDTTQQIILGKSSAYKENFFKRLINLRIGSLRKNKEAKLSDAFNPEKTISIDAQAVSDTFDKCKQHAKKFEEKLEKRVEKASSKAKTLYHKYRTYVVAGFMAISSVTFMSSCSNKQERVPTQQEVVDTPINMKQDTVQTQEVKQETQEEAPVVMPMEYSDSLGVSRTSWLSTQKFDDNSFTRQVDDSTTIRGSEFAYQRLTIAKDSLGGRTIEQGLNAHRYLRSMYPNPENLDGKGIDPATLEAAKIAKELDCFLKGETNVIPEGLDKIFVEQVPGNLNIYATGIENPCDDGKVQYKTLHSKVKEEVAQETVTEEVKDSVEQAPSVRVTDEAFVLGVIEKTDTVKVQQDINISKHNGNQNLEKDKLIKENVSPEEASVEVKGADKHKVLVQNKKSDEIVAEKLNGNEGLTDSKNLGEVKLDGSMQTQSKDSKVLVEGSDTITVKTKKAANLRKEQAKKEARAAKLAASAATPVIAEAEAVVVGKKEEAKEASTVATPVIAEAEAVVISKKEEAKTDVAATSVIAEAEAVAVSKKEEAKADTTAVATEVSHKASGNGGMEEIIFGTENAPLGTPSAFDTPERGGFEGSGITEKADKHNRKVLGDELYDLIVNGTPDHWFNNGNLAGGLSRRQLASVVAVMVVTGPHQETTQELLDAINCQREIRAELFDKVKADIDGIRENRTRDGWTYDKPVYVRKVKNNGCEKKVTLDKVRAENRKKTTASGPKFPRLFRKFIGVKIAEPIVEVIKNVDTVYVNQPIEVIKLNGNEGLTNAKVIETDVPVQKALVEVKDTDKRKVLVQDKKSDEIVAEKLNGNEGLTDSKNLGKVELDANMQTQSKDSKVLVADKKTQTKKGQKKHLTFKIFKQKKAYAAKMAKKKAKQKADEGNAALMAWAEKLK